MLFLVEGEISITQYMGDTKKEKALRIVHADDANQAAQKFRKHFEDKTDEYSVYYSVGYMEVNEEIS